MSLLASIKKFFGFGKQQIAAHNATLVEKFQAKLASLPESERPSFLASEKEQSEAKGIEYVQAARGQSGRAAAFFNEAAEHFALEVFLYQQTHRPTGQAVDPGYEKILGRLVGIAEVFAKPAAELLDQLDSYIQQNEEAIYLSEVKGEYQLAVSENGKWFRFPFLKQKTIRPGHSQDAEHKLQELFATCPQLSIFEMNTRVPWQPISFVECTEKSKEARMSLMYDPSTQYYFAYLYR
jgi:hypothetical protein